MKRFHAALLLLFFVLSTGVTVEAEPPQERPNILFAFADDWGYPHASIYGEPELETPNFDRIARQGTLFTRAFVAAPTCTESRTGILSGQHMWRLGTAANLYGTIPEDIPLYTSLLEKQGGYAVGHTGKGWGPGSVKYRKHNPAGKSYGGFDSFLKKTPDDRPFCFWFGTKDPHRGYSDGLRKKMDIDPSDVSVPPYFPDVRPVREDIANYFAEVQRFDRDVGRLIQLLKKHNEFKNTVIVISGDHGWPFPRGKSNLYDSGSRVPLAIRMPQTMNHEDRVNALVNLSDLAPTFLEVAGVEVPDQMTAHSLVPLLLGQETMSDQEHWQREFIGRERHAVAQEAPETGGYPMRAIRTAEYLYIRNMKPDRWPAGTPNWKQAQKGKGWYADIDNGPTKFYMFANRKNPEVEPLFELAFEKRPAEELYHIPQDPYQLNNRAEDPAYKSVKSRLRRQLNDELTSTGDPRVTDQPVKFDDYEYTGGQVNWPGQDTIDQYKEGE